MSSTSICYITDAPTPANHIAWLPFFKVRTVYKYILLGLLLVIVLGIASLGFLDLSPPENMTKKEIVRE